MQRAAITGMAIVLLLPAISAVAAVFPDVPDGHIHQQAIEQLVGAQVINGHPDGTFRPTDPVNRAAMLKMLYKASAQVPDPSASNCFKDVEKGSWYEPYVCDAVQKRYVQGYNDGTFRPDNSVNRVEALKMIALVLDIRVPEITTIDRDVLKFVDVSTAAWYTKYVYTAFAEGILPIPGQDGSRFHPSSPLLRSEAAAYIYNALNLDLKQEREEVEAQAKEQEQSQKTQASQSSSVPSVRILNVDFPFNDSQLFEGKMPIAYRFSLSAETVADIVVTLKTGQPGTITCRLYRIEGSGLSSEYYLGYEEGSACYIRAGVKPGSYQLELKPSQSDVSYDVAAVSGSGDGNDGFSQAKTLKKGTLRTDVLEGGDIADWFTFSVGAETEMTVLVVSAEKLGCIIYPLADVDLFGFEGPECGKPYLYPTGTYLIGVTHATPRAAKQTYSVQVE